MERAIYCARDALQSTGQSRVGATGIVSHTELCKPNSSDDVRYSILGAARDLAENPKGELKEIFRRIRGWNEILNRLLGIEVQVNADTDVPAPVLSVFKDIVTAPIIEDTDHHYTSLSYRIQIDKNDCRRITTRRGARVTAGATQFIEFEIGSGIPIGDQTTNHWTATNLTNHQRLLLDVTSASNLYRKTCRVWLDEPVVERQQLNIETDVNLPFGEIDGFGSVGVKLRGYKCGIDLVFVRIEFILAPTDVRVFSWRTGTVRFAPMKLKRYDSSDGPGANFEISLDTPEEQQLLFTWFRAQPPK